MKTPSTTSPLPFFIVGCTRSGTTLLRDLLRLHPNLNAPEETFFYRWGEPFGTDGYKHPYLNNPTIKHHQKLDGINTKHLKDMLNESSSRREFNTRYANAYLRKTQSGERWFDKTPQNIYGLLLIHAQFPKSSIVHIYRNPLNVVSSLREGKVMPKQSLVAAINYWLEAMQIISSYKKMRKNNLLEVKYELLCETPQNVLKQLLKNLAEDPETYDFGQITTSSQAKPKAQKAQILIKKDTPKYLEVLSKDEIATVLDQCGNYMKQYGYDLA
jgi:hypothetical protein